VVATVLHEAAHFYLHTGYHEALERLGAGGTSFAAHHSELFV
jgi:hypothetical protein